MGQLHRLRLEVEVAGIMTLPESHLPSLKMLCLRLIARNSINEGSRMIIPMPMLNILSMVISLVEVMDMTPSPMQDRPGLGVEEDTMIIFERDQRFHSSPKTVSMIITTITMSLPMTIHVHTRSTDRTEVSGVGVVDTTLLPVINHLASEAEVATTMTSEDFHLNHLQSNSVSRGILPTKKPRTIRAHTQSIAKTVDLGAEEDTIPLLMISLPDLEVEEDTMRLLVTHRPDLEVEEATMKISADSRLDHHLQLNNMSQNIITTTTPMTIHARTANMVRTAALEVEEDIMPLLKISSPDLEVEVGTMPVLVTDRLDSEVEGVTTMTSDDSRLNHPRLLKNPSMNPIIMITIIITNPMTIPAHMHTKGILLMVPGILLLPRLGPGLLEAVLLLPVVLLLPLAA